MLTFKSLPINTQHITLPLIVIIFSSLALFIDTELLHYQRDLIINGELWRGLSSHFLHTNLNHYLLNISAVILLWMLHGQFYTHINYLVIFIVCAVTTTFGVYTFSPEITQYVGLSGVLHGVFVWGAIKDIQHKEKTGYFLLAAVLVKVIYEQFAGPSEDISTLISATVAIDAHLWGMIGGLLIGLTSLTFYQKHKL